MFTRNAYVSIFYSFVCCDLHIGTCGKITKIVTKSLGYYSRCGFACANTNFIHVSCHIHTWKSIVTPVKYWIYTRPEPKYRHVSQNDWDKTDPTDGTARKCDLELYFSKVFLAKFSKLVFTNTIQSVSLTNFSQKFDCR